MQQSEAAEGDLKLDGDTLDTVPAIYDFGIGLVTSFGVAIDGAFGPSYYAARDGFIGVIVSEASQGGIDLNGDGDKVDGVMFAIAVETSEPDLMFSDSFETRDEPP